MDNLLFTTGIKNTFEEFQMFNNTIRKIRKLDIISNVMYVILGGSLLVSGFMTMQSGDTWDVLAFLPSVLFVALIKPLRKKSMERVWRDSDEADDVWYYGFFEDYMEQTTRKGMNRIYYNQLYEIIETETHFYPMVGKNSGYLIRKENCRPELIAFLHEKARALQK